MAQIPYQGRDPDAGRLAGPVRPESPLGFVQGHGPSIEAMRREIVEGEQMYTIFGDRRGDTALVGVTNRRVMLLDTAYDEGRIALTSVPLQQISTCSYVTSADEPLSEAVVVGIKVGRSMFEVTCSSAEEAQDLHGLIMWHLIGL